MNGVFKLRDETHYHLRHTTLTTHTTYILTHTTVGPIYSVFISSESKYLLKLKIKTLSSGLKKKLENGNLLIALAESAKLL